jgi:aspartate/methionine/tyrosine aminotransferase
MRPEPFALERFFARTEFTARHLLATSDCEGLAMGNLLALAGPDLLARWHDLRLGYTESEGSWELRAEVAGLYESVSGDAILVSAPEEAVFLFMNALLDPGDHVVCTFPGYQSLYQLAVSLGCEVSFWEPREQARWRFDPSRLEHLIRPHTKLVVWNFPHNPTGALPSQEEFQAMLDAAARVGAWVFSDEMYRLLEPSSEQRLPAAADRYERAVSLAGMSKVFGLAGLRIGWLAAHDQALLERCKAIKDYTTICSSAPSEMLSLIALRARDDLLEKHRLRLRQNIETASAFFARQAEAFSWVPPEGGTVCFPRLNDGSGSVPGDHATPDRGTLTVAGAEAFCARALEDVGVLLLPSTVYGYGDAHFRLGLGRSDFRQGLDVLEDYLDPTRST